VVRATARNWATHQVSSWNALQGLLYRYGGAAAVWAGDTGGVPSQSFPAPMGTITVGADATNNCLAVTYTPPAGNTDGIHVSATVDMTETQ
jgi:hypothetical protein